MGILSELRRRNVLRMAVLYAIAAWLIMQVTEVLMTLVGLPLWTGQAILAVLAVGFPIALLFSWFYELTPEGMKLERDIDPADSVKHVTGRRLDFFVISLLAAAVIVFAYDKWWLRDDTAIVPPVQNSVAVLPFVNMSGNPDNEYLSDGLTETLLHALAQLPDLRVPARTSSFFFKGQDIDVRDIAAHLGVSKVLEGSVQRSGDKIRIVAQLIEAESGFHLWSKTYDREMNDIFAVQDDIANSVALAMEITLAGDSGQAGGKIETVGTDNVAAYEKYLVGLQRMNIQSNTSSLLAEISFRGALALDPDFYEARLELAHTYMSQAKLSEITLSEAEAYVIPLLDQLLEERPDDGLVLILAGWIQGVRSYERGDEAFDVEQHLAGLSAAIERTPNEPRLYSEMVSHLRAVNRREEAFEWVERGIVVDPLDWTLHQRRAQFLMGVGDLDGAQVSFARVIELNPDSPTGYTSAANIHWFRKQYAQAFALEKKAMEADPLDSDMPATIALALYTFGLMEEGDNYLQRATSIAPDKQFLRLAGLFRLLLLDDHSRARDMSETLLRDDEIDNRFGLYRFASMVFVSTMTESGKTEEALAVLEELRPGVLSPDFDPRGAKEVGLRYHAVLALAQSQSRDKTLAMLDKVESRLDESFPRWRGSPGLVAPIAMARGLTEIAIELTLEDLANWWLPEMYPYLVYRHIGHYKVLAQDPAVAGCRSPGVRRQPGRLPRSGRTH